MVTIREGMGERWDSDGFNSVRRCDSRCYDAKGKVCRCICCGAHHGKGLDAAVAAELGGDTTWFKEERARILKARVETERRKRAAAAAQGDLFATKEESDGRS